MQNKKRLKETKYIWRTVLFTFFLALMACSGAADKISVFYDTEVPQFEFAVNDIQKALESKGYEVEVQGISALKESDNKKKVVIALASDQRIKELLLAAGGNEATDLGAQAYALRTTSNPEISYWILGGDVNGAMYGGLQIAENIQFEGFTGTYNEEIAPYLLNRGVKFNIPLDKNAPTYFYNNGGTSHQLAIADVWDMEFWKTWFDEMARHRYNVLSLWSPHPFTSMLNMEDAYPGIAIHGVEGYDRTGKSIVLNNMPIDEKIEFWKHVMRYGRERGFSTYFCTWNIFLSTAEGKHGLTHSPDNQETRAYIRKCTKQFFETYPDLAGLGITVGERMGGLNAIEKEEWAWDTYGRGIMEYAQEHPDRDVVFIHRQHQGDISHILEYFDPLTELPNVRFDLSFKYSKAHVHATTTPSYWYDANMEQGLDKYHLKSWLTVRNDDFYFLHWADPQFVRAYVKNFPAPGKYVNAFYIGADGWVFTKVFTSRDPYYEERDMLSIQRTWYMQKLWGRISYNPDVSDDLFKNHLAQKYPQISAERLFEAWSNASRAIQLANEQVTGTWNLDFKWWPEGWTSKDGFRTLEETREVVPMRGSELCSFANTASGKCTDKLSAFNTAEQIVKLADEALLLLGEFDAGTNRELALTIKNLQAMAYLSLYSANKYRAAIFLEQDKKNEALDAIGIAYGFWKTYTNRMDELFIPVNLQRNLDFDSWHAHDQDALQDYLDLGGEGEPVQSE